jgi:hypothetical protein
VTFEKDVVTDSRKMGRYGGGNGISMEDPHPYTSVEVNARVKAQTVKGSVTGITVSAGGTYESGTVPTITVSEPAAVEPTGQGFGLAQMTALMSPAGTTVTGASVDVAGFGYTSVPTLTFSGDNPPITVATITDPEEEGIDYFEYGTYTPGEGIRYRTENPGGSHAFGSEQNKPRKTGLGLPWDL